MLSVIGFSVLSIGLIAVSIIPSSTFTLAYPHKDNPEKVPITNAILAMLVASHLVFKSTSFLSVGDIITAIDGHPITSQNDLMNYIYQHKMAGGNITFTIYRNGYVTDMKATFG